MVTWVKNKLDVVTSLGYFAVVSVVSLLWYQGKTKYFERENIWLVPNKLCMLYLQRAWTMAISLQMAWIRRSFIWMILSSWRMTKNWICRMSWEKWMWRTREEWNIPSCRCGNMYDIWKTVKRLFWLKLKKTREISEESGYQQKPNTNSCNQKKCSGNKCCLFFYTKSATGFQSCLRTYYRHLKKETWIHF